MTEPDPPGELLTGREPATPFRLLFRVALFVFAVVLIVGGIAFGVWELFN